MKIATVEMHLTKSEFGRYVLKVRMDTRTAQSTRAREALEMLAFEMSTAPDIEFMVVEAQNEISDSLVRTTCCLGVLSEAFGSMINMLWRRIDSARMEKQ